MQGSIIYARSPLPQGTASQLGPVSRTYPSVSSPSQSVAIQSTTVQGSQKWFTSTFTWDSGTQAGSSTPFTLQGSTAYGVSPQDAAIQLVRGWSLPYASQSPSFPQPGPFTTVQGSLKQFTSTFTRGSGTQAGSSTPFILKESTAYGGTPQPQGAASQFAPGSLSSYASVSLSSPQACSFTTILSSLKQFTSTFTGGSSTQAGYSTPFTLQGSTAYGGSPQGAASQFVPGSQSSYASASLSSPQAVAGHGSVQGSRRQFTSSFTGVSGTQAEFSTPFTQQGGYPCSYQGYSLSQSREFQKWQPSATRLTPVICTSDATASQGSSLSQSTPMQLSSLSSVGVCLFRQMVVAPFTVALSNLKAIKYTSSIHLGPITCPHDTSVAGRGTSSASGSEVLLKFNEQPEW